MDEDESEGNMMVIDEEERKEPIGGIAQKESNLNNNNNHEEDASAKQENGLHNISGSRSETCKVCYEADADAAFIPCGHVTACIQCA